MLIEYRLKTEIKIKGDVWLRGPFRWCEENRLKRKKKKGLCSYFIKYYLIQTHTQTIATVIFRVNMKKFLAKIPF